MVDDKTNKIMATATVAIAIGAAIQGVVSFQGFASAISGKATEIGALFAVGVLTIAAVIMALISFLYLFQKK